MTDHQHTLISDLLKIIKAGDADSTLLIGASDLPADLCKDSVAAYKPLEFDQLDLLGDDKYKLALVWKPSQRLAAEDVAYVLAKLRDRLCERVYVVETITDRSVYASQKFLRLQKLGFKLLDWYADKDALFYFDLFDYKQLPDWLNNRYWANPERWEKERW